MRVKRGMFIVVLIISFLLAELVFSQCPNDPSLWGGQIPAPQGEIWTRTLPLEGSLERSLDISYCVCSQLENYTFMSNNFNSIPIAEIFTCADCSLDDKQVPYCNEWSFTQSDLEDIPSATPYIRPDPSVSQQEYEDSLDIELTIMTGYGSDENNGAKITSFAVGDLITLTDPPGDSNVPNITLIGPSDDHNMTEDTTVTITCKAQDDIALTNLSILTNISGSWQTYSTISLTSDPATTEKTQDFDITIPDPGNYIWACLAFDNDSQQVISPNRTINVTKYIPPLGQRSPEITLINPPDAYQMSSESTVRITCKAEDDGSLKNLSLFTNISGVWQIDSSIDLTGGSDISVKTQDFDVYISDPGSYIWACSAFDNDDQETLSQNRTLDVSSCTLTSAQWNLSSAYSGSDEPPAPAGRYVPLSVDGTGCNGKTVMITVWEYNTGDWWDRILEWLWNSFGASRDRYTANFSITFDGNSAQGQWRTMYPDDGDLDFGGTEAKYYIKVFKDILEDESNYSQATSDISSPTSFGRRDPNPLLQVNEDQAGECEDNIDNDNNGFCDTSLSVCTDGSTISDSGCIDKNDKYEAPACFDTQDNDGTYDPNLGLYTGGDTYIDYELDIGCEGPYDNDEGLDPAFGTTACTDGIDNDGDGLIDFYDPGCSGPGDSDENLDPTDPSSDPQCSDGLDNDADGSCDFDGCYIQGTYLPADTGCRFAGGNIEDQEITGAICSDGIDNDGDGFIDYFGADGLQDTGDEDVGCIAPGSNSESTAYYNCSDGIDNDGDGLMDLDDPGCLSRTDFDETNIIFVPECSDNLDNDADGLIDLNDPGCTDSQDNNESNPVSSPQCSDGLDNDADGLNDTFDPGCYDTGNYNSSDDNEQDILPQCGNNFDDDNDGLIDYPQDPDCDDASGESTEFSPTEHGKCDDGLDNDNDGYIDCCDIACINTTACVGSDIILPDPWTRVSLQAPKEYCNNNIDDNCNGVIDEPGNCDDCGNGIIDAGEACDFNAVTYCPYGYTGSATCSNDCSSKDTSNCKIIPSTGGSGGTGLGIIINLIYPEQASTFPLDTTNLTVKIKTGYITSCRYKKRSDPETAYKNFNNPNSNNHSANLTGFVPGLNEFDIICTFSGSSTRTNLNIIIDDSIKGCQLNTMSRSNNIFNLKLNSSLINFTKYRLWHVPSSENCDPSKASASWTQLSDASYETDPNYALTGPKGDYKVCAQIYPSEYLNTYTCESEKVNLPIGTSRYEDIPFQQSKLTNKGRFDVIGDLTIRIKKYDSGEDLEWPVLTNIVPQKRITLGPGEFVKLDEIWYEYGGFFPHSKGTYKVEAEFKPIINIGRVLSDPSEEEYSETIKYSEKTFVKDFEFDVTDNIPQCFYLTDLADNWLTLNDIYGFRYNSFVKEFMAKPLGELRWGIPVMDIPESIEAITDFPEINSTVFFDDDGLAYIFSWDFEDLDNNFGFKPWTTDDTNKPVYGLNITGLITSQQTPDDYVPTPLEAVLHYDLDTTGMFFTGQDKTLYLWERYNHTKKIASSFDFDAFTLYDPDYDYNSPLKDTFGTILFKDNTIHLWNPYDNSYERYGTFKGPHDNFKVEAITYITSIESNGLYFVIGNCESYSDTQAEELGFVSDLKELDVKGILSLTSTEHMPYKVWTNNSYHYLKSEELKTTGIYTFIEEDESLNDISRNFAGVLSNQSENTFMLTPPLKDFLGNSTYFADVSGLYEPYNLTLSQDLYDIKFLKTKGIAYYDLAIPYLCVYNKSNYILDIYPDLICDKDAKVYLPEYHKGFLFTGFKYLNLYDSSGSMQPITPIKDLLGTEPTTINLID